MISEVLGVAIDGTASTLAAVEAYGFSENGIVANCAAIVAGKGDV